VDINGPGLTYAPSDRHSKASKTAISTGEILLLRQSLHKCTEPVTENLRHATITHPQNFNNNVWNSEAATHAIFFLSMASQISIIGRTVPITL
jgi:hypothetical protein